MAILPVRFLGGAQWADTHLVTTSAPIGTGSITIADTATTSILLPRPHAAQCQLLGISMQVLVAALSAGGTVLAQVFKRDNSGTPTDRTLTGTKSLEADVVTVLDKSYAIAITATSIQNLTFVPGDCCRIDVVTTSSMGTQPTMLFTATWAIVKP